MVMSWLVNSMTSEIGENFLPYKSANEIWNTAKELYSKKENTSEIFDIEATLQDLKQRDLSVTQYYNTLTPHWQQLDVFEEHEWSCSDDAKKFREFVKRMRIFKFLMGLNKSLDDVQGRILGTKPLPNIGAVFSKVPHESSRKKVMMGEPSVPVVVPVTETSALAARGFQNNNYDNRPRKERPWCDHCWRPEHT